MKHAWLALSLLACTGRGEVLRAAPEGAGGEGPVVLQQTETRLAAGQNHACVVQSGRLSCWGRSNEGELGAPAGGDSGPRTITVSNALRAPAAGETHTCALDTQGSVYCFGNNEHGQLGSFDTTDSATPKLVSLRASAVDLKSGFEHSCALLSDASVWCWGYNLEGQLGLGDTHPGKDQLAPVQVGTTRDWTYVSTGQGHSCGIRSPGALYCWGRNTGYQIGQGSNDPQQYRSPTRVGSDSDWVEVSAGQNNTCARKQNRTIYCWGSLDSGVLGVGDLNPRTTPTRVPVFDDWLSVSTNTFHTCGVRQNGEIWCAGRNTEGQLGAPNQEDAVPSMQRVGSDTNWAEVRAGRFFTCARKTDDSVWCAGANDDGQVSTDLGTTRSAVFLKVTL